MSRNNEFESKNRFEERTKMAAYEEIEVPGFVITQIELFALAKFWEKRALEAQWDTFPYGPCGAHSRYGSQGNVDPMIDRRLNCIGRFIGDEALNQAVEEARAEFGRTKGPALWRIFKNGTADDWIDLIELGETVGTDSAEREIAERVNARLRAASRTVTK